jgi:ribonuclease P protein component
MLPAGARLRSGREISETVRNGVRASYGSALTVHLLTAPASCPQGMSRAAFAVGRPVGGAVVRNRLRRRLRHLLASRLASLPPGSRLVVRAAPSAAALDARLLARALDRALDSAVARSALTGAGG